MSSLKFILLKLKLFSLGERIYDAKKIKGEEKGWV